MPRPVTTVVIAGRRLEICTGLAPGHVAAVGAHVERAFTAAQGATPGGDAADVALVVALNLAAELFEARAVLAGAPAGPPGPLEGAPGAGEASPK